MELIHSDLLLRNSHLSVWLHRCNRFRSHLAWNLISVSDTFCKIKNSVHHLLNFDVFIRDVSLKSAETRLLFKMAVTVRVCVTMVLGLIALDFVHQFLYVKLDLHGFLLQLLADFDLVDDTWNAHKIDPSFVEVLLTLKSVVDPWPLPHDVRQL